MKIKCGAICVVTLTFMGWQSLLSQPGFPSIVNVVLRDRDGADELGRSLGAGVYILRMVAGNFSKHRKVTLLR